MRPKSLLLLVLALGCGLVASIGITQVMAKRDGGAAVSNVEMEPIFVALEQIPEWTPLSPQHLKLEEWPKDKVPEGALSKIEDIEGRLTRTRIYPGDPILNVKLFGEGEGDSGAGDRIPKGFRVVSVKVDAERGNSGLILPGNRVDVAVVLRADRSRGIIEATTKTFLQNIKVFAVNDQFKIDPTTDDKTITAKTVSLLVTPEQAQMVMVATEAGKVRLTLRGPNEEERVAVPQMDLGELLGRDETGNPDDESLVEKTKKESPKQSLLAKSFSDFLARSRAAKPPQGTTSQPEKQPETWQIRVVLGGQPEQVVLRKQDGRWRNEDEMDTISPDTGNLSQDPPGAFPAPTAGSDEPDAADGDNGDEPDQDADTQSDDDDSSGDD